MLYAISVKTLPLNRLWNIIFRFLLRCVLAFTSPNQKLPFHCSYSFHNLSPAPIKKLCNGLEPNRQVRVWAHIKLFVQVQGRSSLYTQLLAQLLSPIIFIECKWEFLSEKDAEKVLSQLKKKILKVDWKNDLRKEYLGIFARKIDGKNSIRKKGFLAWDLEDFTIDNKGRLG